MNTINTIDLALITGGVGVGAVSSPKVLQNPGSSVASPNVGSSFGSGASAVPFVGGGGSSGGGGASSSFADRFNAVGGSGGGGVSGGGVGGGGGGGW
jgi:hypothetical protein